MGRVKEQATLPTFGIPSASQASAAGDAYAEAGHAMEFKKGRSKGQDHKKGQARSRAHEGVVVGMQKKRKSGQCKELHALEILGFWTRRDRRWKV